MTASTTRAMIFGEKTIVILLILTLLSIPLAVIAILETDTRTFREMQDYISRQATQTRSEVDVHANTSQRTLSLIEQNMKTQEPIIEKFNQHINATATAAPIVVQMKPMIEENNRLLEQLMLLLIEQQQQQQNNNNTANANLAAPNSTNNTGSG